MLKITIPENTLWNEREECFINIQETVLCLEHSLVSLSKWESIWHKPFLSTNMTNEETNSYIKCMTLTQNVDPLVYMCISEENYKEINEYISDRMSATWFNEYEDKTKAKGDREIITSEIIYYWMISLNIPMECQKWHINRLFTLIRVCNEKNAPKKKMTKKEILERNRILNEERRRRFNSEG